MLDSVINTVQKVFHQSQNAHFGWVDTLSEMTDVESLVTIKDQLSKIDFLNADNLSNKLDLVLNVDEDSYQKVKRLTYKFLIKLKNNRVLREDVRVVVYEYQRQLYAAYSQLLDIYKTQGKFKLSEEEMNLLLARYLNATFMMAKWRYFDDQPAPHGVWDNVHKVIIIAEEMAMMNKNLFLYHFQIKETSIASILKRGFMVDTLRKGNYSKLEIELTDRILKIWATNPLIVNKYKLDRYQFFIQLADDKGPERVRIVEKFANCRYWKTTRLLDLMEAYLLAIDMHKPLREFGLEKVASKNVVVKLFKKLRTDWCVEGYTRQRRMEARNKKNSLLNLHHGIDDIYTYLIKMLSQQPAPLSEDDGFTFELKVATHRIAPETEAKKMNGVGGKSWWMVDESKSGFAIDFGRELDNWVDEGVLVGYTEMGYQQTLSIAEVKSVRKLSNGTYRAGFKKITHEVKPVQARLVERVAMHEPVENYYLDDGQGNLSYSNVFTGLLVDYGTNTKPKLLIARKQFKQHAHYSVRIGEKDHLLTAGRVISKQQSWVLVETNLKQPVH